MFGRTFADLGSQRGRCYEFMSILVTVQEVIAAVFAAAQ